MIVVRTAKEGDESGLLELAKKAGAGLTTLPAHLPSLKAKVDDSIASFKRAPGGREKSTYLLVMEDLDAGRLVGTAGIIAGVGLDRPFYTYRMLHLTQVSNEPEKRVDTQLLQLSNDFIGACEVATLFLDPDYRRDNLGKLLSKSRYMLMAAYPERFDDRVIAEIRGWVDHNDQSPFWDAIGRHFFGMDFTTADEINSQGNIQFINDLMPKFPIYASLLPKSAQDVIGRPHDNARPAMRLLEGEGFRFTGAVDIFDGGPALEAHRKSIWTVQKCVAARLAGGINGEGHHPDHLVASAADDGFRVVLSQVPSASGDVWLPQSSVHALHLRPGDRFLYAPLSRKTEENRLEPADQSTKSMKT